MHGRKLFVSYGKEAKKLREVNAVLQSLGLSTRLAHSPVNKTADCLSGRFKFPA